MTAKREAIEGRRGMRLALALLRGSAQRDLGFKLFCRLFWATLVVGVSPFLVYAVARLMGALPTEATWSQRGGNHGPWWSETISLPLLGCLVVIAVLPIVTLLISLVVSIRERKWAALNRGFALALLQFALAFAQLVTVYWVIE